jgi:MOSC domain-containing protein YiiM
MGHVEAICIAPAAEAPMSALSEVEALAGVGLNGDRYARGVGYYSPRPTDPGAREVTMLEGEVLDWLAAEHGVVLSPTEHRRNLTTRGVRLEPLIGKRFAVGDVVLEGVRDCPPCEHLEQVTAKRVMRLLLDRAGIRARVVRGGTMRIGDAVVPEELAPTQPVAEAVPSDV